MSRSLTERMRGAARLEAAVYEEVEADTTATGQAATVVALAAVAQAIGAIGEGTGGVVVSLVGGMVAWLVWSGLTYLIGDKLFGGTATWGELLRTIGFAQSPGVLYVFGVVPLVGWIVHVVVSVWVLVAGIIAIRQALDFGTGRAFFTAFVGWIVLGVLALGRFIM